VSAHVGLVELCEMLVGAGANVRAAKIDVHPSLDGWMDGWIGKGERQRATWLQGIRREVESIRVEWFSGTEDRKEKR